MKPAVDLTVQSLLNEKLSKLEEHFQADILSYYGPILDGNESTVLKIVEELANDQNKRERFCVIITTN